MGNVEYLVQTRVLSSLSTKSWVSWVPRLPWVPYLSKTDANGQMQMNKLGHFPYPRILFQWYQNPKHMLVTTTIDNSIGIFCSCYPSGFSKFYLTFWYSFLPSKCPFSQLSKFFHGTANAVRFCTESHFHIRTTPLISTANIVLFTKLF